jgi:hypothetical protein
MNFEEKINLEKKSVIFFANERSVLLHLFEIKEMDFEVAPW